MTVIETSTDTPLLVNDLKNLTSDMLFSTLKIAACANIYDIKNGREEISNYWQKIILHSLIILKVNAILSDSKNSMGHNVLEFYNRLVDSIAFYYRVNKKDNGELVLLLTRLREILNI